ncbi:hypothetical protein [Bradyrhizobium genosp. A]|uniref:hypothetical protein n=1 Tax=Bradyrhizobium genosp. A TaxID=83626 RepID=UPI003CF68724
MTIFAEATTTSNAGTHAAQSVPVYMAVRVVAAGIAPEFDATGKPVVRNGEPAHLARATLILTPVNSPSADDFTIDLADWPAQIGALLVPGSTVDVDLVPVQKGGRGMNLDAPPTVTTLKMTVQPHPVANDILTAYWRQVIGDVKSLKGALGTGEGSLKEVLRGTTPDIHGTGRSEVAVALSLERAKQILDRLAGNPRSTRPDADDAMLARIGERVAVLKPQAMDPNTDLGKWVQAGLQRSPPRDQDKEIRINGLVADFARQQLTDEDAHAALEESRKRADAAAAARNKYDTTTSSSGDAIAALVAASDCHAGRSAPAAMAAKLRDNAKAPDLGEAHAEHRLASNTPGIKSAPPVQTRELEIARRRFFALQANPSLARLFRFVVDVQCPANELFGKAAQATDYPDNALDFDATGSAVQTDLPLPDPPGDVTARFLLLGLRLPQKQAAHPRLSNIWTTAKLRWKQGARAGHFYPCTREEIDARAAQTDLRALAIAEQIDGLVDLGQQARCDGDVEPRFDVLTLDAITATAADIHLETVRTQQVTVKRRHDKDGERLPPDVVDEGADLRRATLRTGGLALADRWRQNHAIARHVAALRQYPTRVPGADPHVPAVLLDASDVTVGYKLDVGVKSRREAATARRRWHTLMRRTVFFNEDASDPHYKWTGGGSLDATINALYRDRLTRLRADDGILTVPAALSDNGANKTGFAEEIIGAWRGDPLGLACGTVKYRLDSSDLRINMTFDLPSRKNGGADADDFAPPPLRFGWRYHFGLRAVFAGGVSMPLERALGHYEKSHDGGLVIPAVTRPGRSFRRHERIDAPRIAIPEEVLGEDETAPAALAKTIRLRNRFGAPQALRMIVRTVKDGENRQMLDLPEQKPEQKKGTLPTLADLKRRKDTGVPGLSIARRVLMVPSVSLDFAGLHDAFRDSEIDDKDLPILFLPRVMQDDETDPAPDEGLRTELVAGSKDGERGSFWREVKVAWQAQVVKSRPRGGLKGIDHHAAWGGFPIFRMQPVVAAGAKPKKDQPVSRSEEVVTDLGEVVNRMQAEPVTFKNPPAPGHSRTQSIDWYAVAGVPAGDAVFRPLPAARAKEKERVPYYPDPATAAIVVSVSVRGKDKNTPLRTGIRVAKVYAAEPKNDPVPAGYPDALPVVLDVVRGVSGSEPLIEFGTGGENGNATYSGLSGLAVPSPASPAPIQVRHVIITLAPGEEATVRAWCLPTLTFIKHMYEGTEAVAAFAVSCGCLSLAALKDDAAVDEACRAGFAAMCGQNLPADPPGAPSGPAVGGLPAPSLTQIEAIAKAIYKFMGKAPLPEISAYLEIDAVHAIDLPHDEPRFDPPGAPLPLLRADGDDVKGLLFPDPGSPSPLSDPKNWTIEAQRAGATGVLLDGNVTLHGPTTGAVEIYASAAAAARGRFDDPDRGRSRDDRVRGLWPNKPEGDPIAPKDLFGFVPSSDGRVTHLRETVTLLRVEGFTPDKSKINLLEAQRAAAKAEKDRLATTPVDDENATLRAVRAAAILDARARHLDLYAVAVSRHAGLLRTRYDELLDNQTKPSLLHADRPLARQWLPATVRPARVAPQSLIPSFLWRYGDDNSRVLKNGPSKKKEVSIKRKMFVRARMRRPWFSSGEGERIGVVLWPPNLFQLKSEDIQGDVIRDLAPGRAAINLTQLPSDDPKNTSAVLELQDADLGLGGAWVTRWGADPIRPGYPVQGWLLSPANFPGTTVATQEIWNAPPEARLPDSLVVENALMPVPAGEDAPESLAADPASGFMNVALATYEARFDPEQELWYADIGIDALDVSWPFVRVGLVRYQPHAPRRLQVSEPIVEWIQVMPERTVTASAETRADEVVLSITAKGPGSKRGAHEAMPESSSAQRPLVRMALLRRGKSEDGPEIETVKEMLEAVSDIAPGGLVWKQQFKLTKREFGQEGVSWSVFVEEVERLRPASYPDEPRYGTKNDSEFAETGPRFAARLELVELRS